jgi:signal transduction histidine kinase
MSVRERVKKSAANRKLSKEMPHFDALADEVNILYAASNRLTQASTPTEWLEAISGYAREQGATTGVLLYIEADAADYPQWCEVVAYWTVGAGRSADVGARFDLSEMPNFVAMWVRTPDRPIFVPDAINNELIDERARSLNAHYNMQSSVILPLNNNGHWIGFAMFTWTEQRYFDERDKRIFTAMIQQAAPVIDSMRLFEESRERVARAEHLLKINTALSQADSETDILEALALYASSQHIVAISMDYLDYAESDAPMHPSISRTVALWKEGQAYAYERAIMRLYRTEEFGINDLVRDYPDDVLFIESIADETRLSLENRQFVLANMKSRALAVMPLYSGGRYQGGITLMWNKPHVFSDEERYVYSAILQTLSSTVASRRAYLAEEEARQESELLYRASKGVNSAMTFAEIVDAITLLTPHALHPVLVIFENYNAEGASYVDVVSTERPGWSQGNRFPLEALPIALTMSRKDILVVEDTTNRDQIDAITAATLEQNGVRSIIDVPLFLADRCMGLMSFESYEPHVYSPFEKRVASGIADLVAAAVERIRLREKTDSSRVRAELLAQVNAALSQSNDEQGILSSVSLLAERYGVSLSTLAYLDINAEGSLQAINIVALRSSDGRSPLPLNFLPVSYFRVEDYPILQVAYASPDQPTFIENSLTDPRTDDGNTRHFSESLDWNAVILIPLKAGDQWQGLLTFIWNTPQVFNDDMHRLFMSVQAPATSVVASRRAYLAAEEARKESELLYRASEAVNAANSFEEIAQAVALIDGGTHSIALTRWENYDFDSATYFEVLATASNSPQPPGKRYSIADFPMVYKMPRKALWVIEDMTKDPRVDPVSAASWLKDNTYARIGVPLTLNNRWMGNLAFHSTRPKTYSPLDKRLVTGIGDLVTAAFERIRLREQTETARRRAESLASVNAALSQATDEWSILAAVSQYIGGLQPDFLSLNYIDIDEDGQPIRMIPMAVIEYGVPSLGDDVLKQSFVLADFPATSLWMDNASSILMQGDIRGDARLENPDAAYWARWHYQALVLIPLYSGGRWQGIIGCSWKEPRVFTDYDRTMCEALIQTAGAVVASRRAYKAEERASRENEARAHELETVAKVSAVAASVLNKDELLDTVSYLTRVSFSQYHILIYLLDETAENLVQAMRPAEASAKQNHSVSIRSPRSMVARAAQIRQGIIVNDITNTPDYSLTPILPEARSEMAVPMVVADRLIGVLDIQSAEVNRFAEDDIRVMSTLADLIAVAVENARLYEQAQEIAAFEERNRLARELHDSVSQALYGIALGTRTARILLDRDPTRLAEPLDYVMSLAEAGLTEMRALIFELRPESLENEGLVAALTKQAASVQARHGVAVTTDLGSEPPFSIDVKEALYRIAREALHNIVKHANAGHVTLSIVRDDGNIHLEICDDGKGFDPNGDFPGHLGLQSMRERVERLGGKLAITSAPGEGTSITVDIPHN